MRDPRMKFAYSSKPANYNMLTIRVFFLPVPRAAVIRLEYKYFLFASEPLGAAITPSPALSCPDTRKAVFAINVSSCLCLLWLPFASPLFLLLCADSIQTLFSAMKGSPTIRHVLFLKPRLFSESVPAKKKKKREPAFLCAQRLIKLTWG